MSDRDYGAYEADMADKARAEAEAAAYAEQEAQAQAAEAEAMSDQPLPCPFCANVALVFKSSGQPLCANCGAVGPMRFHPDQFLEAWQNRPTETALRDRIAELEQTVLEEAAKTGAVIDALSKDCNSLRRLEADLCAEIVGLKARVGELERDMEAWKEEAGTFEEQAADLKAERDRLREALRFYANPDAYYPPMCSPMVEDVGERARQAIGKEATE